VEKYEQAIGVGECAGVVIDLIATLLFESEEKIQLATTHFDKGTWAASIYYSYSAMVNAAKALLTAEDTKTNTHASIIADFDEKFVASGRLVLPTGFEILELQINQNEPSESFASSYLDDTKGFLRQVEAFRKLELAHV
ncbi:MAG: nitrite reductase, partial [Flavobacteriaceae bacterium]